MVYPRKDGTRCDPARALSCKRAADHHGARAAGALKEESLLHCDPPACQLVSPMLTDSRTREPLAEQHDSDCDLAVHARGETFFMYISYVEMGVRYHHSRVSHIPNGDPYEEGGNGEEYTSQRQGCGGATYCPHFPVCTREHGNSLKEVL